MEARHGAQSGVSNVMSLTFAKSTVRQSAFISSEVLVDPAEPEQPVEKTLFPLVDTMWQVGGYQGTPCKRRVAHFSIYQ